MYRIINIRGDEFYFEGSLLHRVDGPAIIFKSGTNWWIQNGELHRENGPAIVSKKSVEYWINGHKANTEEKKNIKRNYWIDKIKK